MPEPPPADPSGWHSIDDIVTALNALAEAPLPTIDPPPANADLYGIRLHRAFQEAYRRDHPDLFEAATEWERTEVREAREAGRRPTFRILHARAYLPVAAARRYLAEHPQPVAEHPEPEPAAAHEPAPAAPF